MVRLNSLVLASVLLAALIPHLLALNYSILSFEVVFFTLASVLVGFGIGHIARNRFVFGAILGCGIYFFLDAYFVEFTYAGVVFVLCVCGVPLLLRYWANSLPLVVLVFSIVFILPDLFKSQEPLLIENDARVAVSAAADTPEVAYVHLILDAQASPLATPEAMPSDFTSADFFEPYLRNGFKVYGIANANSKNTTESLSAIFGLTNSTENFVEQGASAEYSNLVDDDHLVQNLINLGFSTTVIESSYLRLCGEEELLHCRTYRRASNMRVVETLGLPFRRRLELAYIGLHQDYLFGAKNVYLYQLGAMALNALRSESAPTTYDYFSRAMVNVGILRDIEEQVTDIQPGEAIIAHFLLPHLPYVLDRDCKLKAPSDWGYPLRFDYLDSPTKAYETYWDQSICTGSLIARVLDRVGDRDDVVVFVHGDHGSRIFFETNAQNDADSFGTILAVKAPNQNAGLIVAPVSLQPTFTREFMSAIGAPSVEN